MCRKVSTQTMVRQENPTASGSPKLRTAERTRTAKLGFLDEKLSFHPKIIQNVPDFSRLHKALQTEVLRKTQIKDVTKCQPFCLRTSALPARQRTMSPENSQVKNWAGDYYSSLQPLMLWLHHVTGIITHLLHINTPIYSLLFTIMHSCKGVL